MTGCPLAVVSNGRSPLFPAVPTLKEIRPGDVVWFPPGEKHWHGAAPTTAMTHLAIQEQLDGSAVTWLEQVTEGQYRGSDPR